MANWRRNLRPASFKGIKFEVEAHDTEAGRRAHIHEYPNKDVPYAEDMGKKASTYVFDAFVIGDDYISQRDALNQACNSPGPGTLIHPTLGNLYVICTGCRISERNSEGRMARFSLSFTEAGEQAQPASSINFKDKVSELADAAELNATESFTSRFSIIGKASSVANSISGVATTFADNASSALELANSKVDAITNVTDTGINAIDTITSVANKMDDLSTNALNILKTPDVFAARVSESLLVINNFLSPRDALRQTKQASSLGVSEKTARISTETPKGIDEIEMMEQIEVLTQRVGLANQAKTISSIDFTNADEAQQILDDFVDQVAA